MNCITSIVKHEIGRHARLRCHSIRKVKNFTFPVRPDELMMQIKRIQHTVSSLSTRDRQIDVLLLLLQATVTHCMRFVN